MYGEELVNVITALEAVGLFIALGIKILVKYWR